MGIKSEISHNGQESVHSKHSLKLGWEYCAVASARVRGVTLCLLCLSRVSLLTSVPARLAGGTRQWCEMSTLNELLFFFFPL